MNVDINKKRMISFSPPDISELEIQEVVKVLKSGWITTGPKTKELERRLGEFCHVDKMVCLNSGTAAEELNLRILGIGPGDEVIVPAYTYSATASAVVHVGADVVFVDSKSGSPEMDYDKMEAAITTKTKAVVAVDLGGVIADYDRIFEIVERKKSLFHAKGTIQEQLGRIAVLSDCAHGMGASRNGKMAGEIADFTSFSFHAVKNFTTAEGGAAAWCSIPGIDNEELYQKYQLYSLHGQSKDALAKTQLGSWEYDIVEPWYKCNMTDITAAIGLGQFERYPQMLARRKEMIEKYDAVCEKLGVLYLKHYGENFSSSGHLYLTRIPGITLEERNEIITQMAEQGVMANVHYKPLPMMSAYEKMGWDIKDFPCAYEYFENEITLPLHTRLTDEEIAYVTEIFGKIVEHKIGKDRSRWSIRKSG
ncbi:MAG: DegT/DnrJ/EryC1/StrS family aminotransferase [Lachnospiraceae bacterium]|nr:DegT/DnrJ/EryC1/StrS family aminotransferase [Lachnospiraceae bacterium]